MPPTQRMMRQLSKDPAGAMVRLEQRPKPFRTLRVSCGSCRRLVELADQSTNILPE
jgi:hypothetical protein